MNDLLAHFLDTVHLEYFMDFPLWRTEDGRIAGEYFKVRLESRFVPARDEHGELLGVAAELVALTPAGDAIGQETLMRLTRVSESPVVLDRFIRCVHLLNYLHRPAGTDGKLLLPVSAALLEQVGREHGKVFRRILDLLQLSADAVALLLPESLAETLPLLVRLHKNYQRHGLSAYVPLPAQDADGVRVRPLAEQIGLQRQQQRKRA